VANESRTSDGETTRPGQIGMAVTCGNGYVFDKLLKKKKKITPVLLLYFCIRYFGVNCVITSCMVPFLI